MSYETISLIIISKNRSNRTFRVELSSVMRNSLIIEESLEDYPGKKVLEYLDNDVLRRVDLDRDPLIRGHQPFELIRGLFG